MGIVCGGWCGLRFVGIGGLGGWVTILASPTGGGGVLVTFSDGVGVAMGWFCDAVGWSFLPSGDLPWLSWLVEVGAGVVGDHPCFWGVSLPSLCDGSGGLNPQFSSITGSQCWYG